MRDARETLRAKDESKFKCIEFKQNRTFRKAELTKITIRGSRNQDSQPQCTLSCDGNAVLEWTKITPSSSPRNGLA